MPNVVFDASSLVGALLKADSTPERALLLARANATLCLSLAVEDEIRGVFSRPKFRDLLAHGRADRILDLLGAAALSVTPVQTVSDCRDPKDNKYLELALAASAEFIVSSDEDLLVLNPWRGIPDRYASGICPAVRTDAADLKSPSTNIGPVIAPESHSDPNSLRIPEYVSPMSSGLPKYAFGWIETPWRIATPEFQVEPSPDHAARVAEVVNSGGISDRWIYTPTLEREDKHTAGASIRFLLPPTHDLKLAAHLNDGVLADFVVMFLGFLVGLNLKPTGLGHLHRTPRRMSHLVNFVPSSQDIEIAVRKAIDFYRTRPTNAVEIGLIRGALHWYLTSQSYHHAFEMFMFQYMVLDNVHRLSAILHPGYASLPTTHTKRPVNLAHFYGIPLPPPFKEIGSTTDNAKKLAAMRNELVHEALWLGHPLGYASDSQWWDTTMNLTHFNSQLLLAVIGIECKFRTLLYSAQVTGLDTVP